ncbi:TetR/AcrR family transcriptional regulator [Lacticaseibacillus mingshuiensis]|uniref:TetR/AcrR family transcriptional regulator n=1 Tax=Lacticaseibacillus mingshuiensis TaxID=2799574 RepID=A0ABW4CF32_9LACO|nr:TetR/AcrR family transcriptional regulator [Lacticaseibacillus mingshuiensis]
MSELAKLFDETVAATDLSDKQKAVLKASLQLFAAKGFDNTSTADIAAAAHVSEGTVYKHFKTKDQLLAAVMRPFVRQVVPRVAGDFIARIQGQAAPDFGTFLHYVIKDRLQFAQENRAEAKIFLGELMHDQAMLDMLLKDFQQVAQGPLTAIFQHYQATGEVVEWPVSEVFWTFLGVMAGHAVPLILMPSNKFDLERAADEATAVLVQGLRPA